MRVRKLDILISKKSIEVEIAGTRERSIFPPSTQFTVGRQNSRWVYLYTDGGTGVAMALEVRVSARKVGRETFEMTRSKQGQALRSKKLFGAKPKTKQREVENIKPKIRRVIDAA